jgi:pyruvate formate lyase activating enzyme
VDYATAGEKVAWGYGLIYTSHEAKDGGKAVREAMLYEPLDRGRVRCILCAHRCTISPGKRGVCRVRENQDGRLVSLVYGRLAACHLDPIEKKPLFHFYPGSLSLSIATVGCNFQCRFCQNHTLSQAPRLTGRISGDWVEPEKIVEAALRSGAKSISYTYTEPTIFYEYAYETSRLAHKEGILNCFVSNGYMTQEALDTFHPYLDAANVDLKGFNDAVYKRVSKARLEPVKESIRKMKTQGVWVEVTTLVVPGLNDSDTELAQIAEFLASIDPAIPSSEAPAPTAERASKAKVCDQPSRPTPFFSCVTKGMDEGKLDLAATYIHIGDFHPDFVAQAETPAASVTNQSVGRLIKNEVISWNPANPDQPLDEELLKLHKKAKRSYS